MTKREFWVESQHRYSLKGPLRWVLSHLLRYPYLPLGMLTAAVINNFAYSGIQVFVGRAFDAVSAAGFELGDLRFPVLAILVCALTQGLLGVGRNTAMEFLAQRIERNSREQLYLSLLGKSQTFHGRQRIGDIMARATNDVRSLNYMFNPGLNLILDSALALIVPMILIGLIDPRLLFVPLMFTGLLVVTVADYNLFP